MKYRYVCLIIFMILILAGCASTPKILKSVMSSESSDIGQENAHHEYVKSDDAFESVDEDSKMSEAPMPEEQMKKSLLLGNAKRDLEAYRLYAKHLHQHNEFDDLEILENASESYIKQYADELLKQETSHPNYETIRLSVVILFTKAMLLYEFNQMDEVDSVMEELETNYHQYYDIAVNHFGYEVIRDTIEKFKGRTKGIARGGTGEGEIPSKSKPAGSSKPSGKKPGPANQEEGLEPEVEEFLDELIVGSVSVNDEIVVACKFNGGS